MATGGGERDETEGLPSGERIPDRDVYSLFPLPAMTCERDPIRPMQMSRTMSDVQQSTVGSRPAVNQPAGRTQVEPRVILHSYSNSKAISINERIFLHLRPA